MMMAGGLTMVDDDAGQPSDDEVYNDVDLISDSDDADPDTVERAEEQNIIGSEEENDVGLREVTSVTGSDVHDHGQGEDPSDWEGFGMDDADPHAHMNSYFEIEMDVGNAAGALDPVLDRAASEVVSEGKRVRFHEEVLYSASISSVVDSSDDGEHYGGLFVQQDELHPRFRSLIENDRDDDMGPFMAAGHYAQRHWTNGRSNHHGLDIDMEEDGASECSEGSSSGYETDEGETTDEDLPPPQSIASTRAVFRRMSIDADEDGEYDSNRIRATLNGSRPRRLGPSLGSWITDPSKPIAVIDSTGKRMVIYPALLPTENEQGSSDSDSTKAGSSRAKMFAPGAQLSRGGLVHTPGAFYPFIDSDTDDTMDEMSHEDDDEIMLKIEDFIDFGDTDDDADDDGEQNDDEELGDAVLRDQGKLKEVLWEGPGVEFRPDCRIELLAK